MAHRGQREHLLVHGEIPLFGLEATIEVGQREVVVDDGLSFRFPIASAEVTVDSAQAGELLVRLGLAQHVLAPAGEFDASFRVYSPGFSGDANETNLIRQVGGFEADARLSVPNFIQDAEFKLAVPLSPATVLDDFSDPLRPLPHFTASAEVSEFNIPGLSGNAGILSFENFFVELRRDDDGLAMAFTNTCG